MMHLNATLGTRRLLVALVTLAIMFVLVLVGMIRGTDLVSLAATLGTIATFSGTYIWAGNNHDAKIRVATIQAAATPATVINNGGA